MAFITKKIILVLKATYTISKYIKKNWTGRVRQNHTCCICFKSFNIHLASEGGGGRKMVLQKFSLSYQRLPVTIKKKTLNTLHCVVQNAYLQK